MFDFFFFLVSSLLFVFLSFFFNENSIEMSRIYPVLISLAFGSLGKPQIPLGSVWVHLGWGDLAFLDGLD
jgi:hypothetical protein